MCVLVDVCEIQAVCSRDSARETCHTMEVDGCFLYFNFRLYSFLIHVTLLKSDTLMFWQTLQVLQ